MKRVFVSFDFDNDKSLKDLIIGQAKNPDSPFEVSELVVVFVVTVTFPNACSCTFVLETRSTITRLSESDSRANC